jgi:hypothetical protein
LPRYRPLRQRFSLQRIDWWFVIWGGGRQIDFVWLLGPLRSADADRVRNLTDRTYLEQKHDLLRSYITAALRYA